MQHMQHDASCCSMIQCVAACCSVLQCLAVCCSVLQYVAVCCSMLQCVAKWILAYAGVQIVRDTHQKRPTKETCKRDLFNRKETKIDQTLYLRAKKKWLRSRSEVCACVQIVGEFRGLLTTELLRPINPFSPYSQFVAVHCGVMQCVAVCCSVL